MATYSSILSNRKALFPLSTSNYLYMSHLNGFVLLPTYPESILDSMSAQYSPTTALGRSAPIFTYSNSGPRTMQINLALHRDLMNMINRNVSNLNLNQILGIDPKEGIPGDYVDVIINQLQAMAVPTYDAISKTINPPTVSVRFGNDIYIRGVVNGSVGVTYSLPLDRNNRYSQVAISFGVSEIDPYSANGIAQQGSFRGFSKTLERRLIPG